THARVRPQREVVARAHARIEEGFGRADEAAVDLVHRVRADAGAVRRVAVVALAKAELAARFDECRLPGDELVRRMAADRQRAVATVPLVLHVEIAFDAL